MGNIRKAVDFVISIAKDNSHGYDQKNRLGPDYDCSSLVATALQKAGFEIDAADTWTGNLPMALVYNGFKSVGIDEPRAAGHIFIKPGKHVVMCIDEKRIVQVSGNEFGAATGGQTGDQTGKEIYITDFYKPAGYNWEAHYVPPEPDACRVKIGDYYLKEPDYYKSEYFGAYYVTNCSWLNVRDGAGVENEIVVQIPADTVVYSFGLYGYAANDTWLLIMFVNNENLYTGYCNANYLRRV